MHSIRLPFLVLAAVSSLCAQKELVILHKAASSVGFYTMDGAPQTIVGVGKHPHEMVASADGSLLYTTDNGTMRIEQAGEGGNTVSIVDLRARKKIGEISLGEYRRPHGIALDAATGRLAVSCERPDRLLILDPASRKIMRTYDTKGKTSHMVAFGPGAKWAYVSNSGSGNVAAIELASGEVRLIPTGARPEGSVLAKDGRHLYVANREGRSVSIIDTAANAQVGDIPTGNGPVRIALTPDGKTLVYALIHDRKVEMADVATRKVIGEVALGGRPVSLSISPGGLRAYASAEEDNTVYVVSVPDRKLTKTLTLPAGTGPDPVLER
jgi:YVTN family beta-propeller protein